MAIDGASVEGIQPISQNSEQVQRSTFGERAQRLQRILGEKVGIGKNLLELKVEEWKFQAEHNLWNAPGYFHTRSDERYFYTIFKQELLHLREGKIADPNIKKRMQAYQSKLINRAQEMVTVHPRDKVRLQEDAQFIAKLYEESRLSGERAGIQFRDEMRKIRMLGGRYRAPYRAPITE